VSELLGEWIATLPPQTIFLVPLFAFLESCLFVGLFVSGIFLLSTVSIIYAQGDTSLFLLIPLSFMGALIGDHIGYFAGSKVAPVLWKKKWVRKKLIKRKVAYRKFRNLMIKSSPWAICVGRLSPPLRSISPVLAGTSGLKPVQFFAYDVLACTIWASGLTALVLGVNQI
jgi:membrane-associated protein